MTNQTKAAMQGALLALADAHRRDEHFAARWVYSEAMDALREALAQPTVKDSLTAQMQGEWVDLTDGEFLERCPPNVSVCMLREFTSIIIAKFKEKNTPPVVLQEEPVAWINHKESGVYAHYQKNTPPSVEAAKDKE